jgi:hypothetical protein
MQNAAFGDSIETETGIQGDFRFLTVELLGGRKKSRRARREKEV